MLNITLNKLESKHPKALKHLLKNMMMKAHESDVHTIRIPLFGVGLEGQMREDLPLPSQFLFIRVYEL